MAIISNFPQGGSGNAICINNVLVNTTAWEDSTKPDYPYKAIIEVENITSNYFPIVVFYENDDLKYHFSSTAKANTGEVEIYAKIEPTSSFYIQSISCYETDISSELGDIGTLEETSWETISAIAQTGAAGSFWSVGDTKSVILNGTVGTVEYVNETTYVYIIGINHEGNNGITFQGFRYNNLNNNTMVTGISNDYALIDEYYEGYIYQGPLAGPVIDGTHCFNMNHWGTDDTLSGDTISYNYGGWKGCDLRYDILGSTDIAPSGYGAIPEYGTRVGYDASPTTATNPVPNTLMAALPSTLRAVMKPMTVYTDNNSIGSFNIETNITTSVDYLPLPGVCEVLNYIDQSVYNSDTGEREHYYESDYQSLYSYYSNGVKLLKSCKYNDMYYPVYWLLRSQMGYEIFFAIVNEFPMIYSEMNCCYSGGISPIFLI